MQRVKVWRVPIPKETIHTALIPPKLRKLVEDEAERMEETEAVADYRETESSEEQHGRRMYDLTVVVTAITKPVEF